MATLARYMLEPMPAVAVMPVLVRISRTMVRAIACGPHTQRAQIWRGVDEHLVNRVDMDVLGCGVFEVDAIYLPADFQIVRHARLGDDHRALSPGERSRSHASQDSPINRPPGSMDRALDVDSIQALFYLKQPRTARNAIVLQRG